MLEMGIRSCKDCKERQVGCHSSCKRYLEDKKKLEGYKKLDKEWKVRHPLRNI